MKTIYAVSSGLYSDYRIDALFSSREKAKKFIAVMGNEYSDYNDVEEFQLDPPVADLLRRGYSVWTILMLRDGIVERAVRTLNDGYDVSDAGHYYIWERTKAPAYQGRGIPDALTMNVWAKTETAAIKIVNEKRAQMIATGEWK